MAFLEDEALYEWNLKKGVLRQCTLDTVLIAAKWRFNVFNLIGNTSKFSVQPDASSMAIHTPKLTDVSNTTVSFFFCLFVTVLKTQSHTISAYMMITVCLFCCCFFLFVFTVAKIFFLAQVSRPKG